MLTAELTRRQTILATQGFSGVAEQRRLGTDPLAHIALLIDGWEAFNTAFDEVDSGAVIDGVFRVLREGAAAGLHVFITADRGGLVGRLASTVENRLVLRLADRGDFALIGLPARSVPQNLPAGRGFLAHDLVETQLCLLGADASGPAQLTELAAIAAAAAERDADVPAARRPRRVDELPSRVALGDLTRRAPMQHTGEVVLGVGGVELDAVRIDL
jgi:S-DNA-T family DNA segregation ATPase FtsK/SpoIIIE